MKMFTRPTASAALAVALLVPAAPLLGRQEAARPAPLRTDEPLARTTARLEQLLPKLMKDGNVPGLSIALLRDGEVVWSHGFGVKNSETKDPVDDATVFEAASLCKPVLAYAVLKLVEAGKFDLDKPLNQYLPGAVDVDDARANQVTARHVLTHTTGLPNGRVEAKLKMYSAPGERFSYSGTAFDYFSKVIEHVTGEEINAFITRTVFEPLEMKSSSCAWRPEYDKLKTFRHNRVGHPSGQDKPPPERIKLGSVFFMHTTARDYGKFVAAVLKGTGLKPETRKLMLTPQIPVREGGPMSVLSPKAKPLADVAWGLGWGLQSAGDGPSFWHWGDAGDCKAYVVAFDKPKLGVVFFANSANGLSFAREIVDAAVGGASPGLDWLNYERYDAPSRVLFNRIVERGAPAALEEYRTKRGVGPAAISEPQMNNLGYDLLTLKRSSDAIEVFKQVVAEYPSSSNAYDSLAEAYEITGDKASAVKNYKRSLELNPKNTHAVEHIKKLESAPSRTTP